MNYKRKKAKANSRSNFHSMRHYPKWWDVVFHTRPTRAANKRLERELEQDKVDPDEALGPVAHKPHKYFW
jgi:hypothetical protein